MSGDDLTPQGGAAVRLALTVTELRAEIAALTQDRDEWIESVMAVSRARDAARADLDRLVAAVRALADAKCENFAEGTCSDDPSRSPNARYTAEGYCWPCRLRALLPTTGPSQADAEPQDAGLPKPGPTPWRHTGPLLPGERYAGPEDIDFVDGEAL